ncbi:MAG: hypothetical protein K2P70_03355 [Hyphomonadaceae bacterium]|nr:hypothetical protein [Hyphomonadaceae bacterium]
MKKAGFIAASVGTAVLLAAGATALTTALLSPNHGVEEAGAAEVAAPAPDADARDGNRGGLFSWFGGGTQQRESQPAAAEGERHVLPGVTEPARATSPTPSRAASDDDDDDDDD